MREPAAGTTRVVTGYENMDMRAVHAFLTEAYWSKGVAFAVVDRAARHSLCFGLFQQERQIGFARVVSDKATFAYLADVYVLEAHRGQGLSRLLLDAVFQHPDLQGLRNFLLFTRDAHGLYAQYGFSPLGDATRLMEKRPNPT